VDFDPNPELIRRLAGRAQELRTTGIDLVREEHAADPPAVSAMVLVDEGLRPVEAPGSLGLVPVVDELPFRRQAVRGGLVGGAQVGPDPEIIDDRDELFARRADLHHRGATALEHLDQRELATDLPILPHGERPGPLGRREVIQEARLEVVAAADVGDQPAAGLRVGVAVEVDQARNEQFAGRVDPPVHRAVERPADEDDLIVLDHETATLQEAVGAVMVRDDVATLEERPHVPCPPVLPR
jgi:hypothetical protein